MKATLWLTLPFVLITASVSLATNIAPDATALGGTAYSSYVVSNINDEVYTDTSSGMYLGAGQPSGSGNSLWMQLNWASDVTFRTVRIYNYAYAAPGNEIYNTKDFTLQIYNAGADTWTIVDTVVGNTDSVYTFESPTPITTNKLFIPVTDPGDGDNFLRIVEIEVDTVPEPATMGLLGISGIMALLRRRR